MRDSSSQFEEIPSSDLQVGDIVKCVEGETFPADLLHLTSSNEGDCYIKTSSLDGEKNLKKRVMCKDLDKIIPKNNVDFGLLKSLTGFVTVENPNKDLGSFKGFMRVKDTEFTISDK